MGGTHSRGGGGRSFAAMNEEQPLTPTTPRRDVSAQPWSLPAPNSTPSDCHSDDRLHDQTPGSVFEGGFVHFVVASYKIYYPPASGRYKGPLGGERWGTVFSHFLFLVCSCFT